MTCLVQRDGARPPAIQLVLDPHLAVNVRVFYLQVIYVILQRYRVLIVLIRFAHVWIVLLLRTRMMLVWETQLSMLTAFTLKVQRVASTRISLDLVPFRAKLLVMSPLLGRWSLRIRKLCMYVMGEMDSLSLS